MLTLQQCADAVASYQAKPDIYQEGMRRAAVAMILHGSEESHELLMFQRAVYEGDPWSAQMAFPGGRVENSDSSLLDTAIRECQEEFGVDLASKAERIGELSERQAGSWRENPMKMVVKPFVFKASASLNFLPNREVQQIVSIPLSYFCDLTNRQIFSVSFNDREYRLPCYLYKGFRIWGLSLGFIDELLQLTKSKA